MRLRRILEDGWYHVTSVNNTSLVANAARGVFIFQGGIIMAKLLNFDIVGSFLRPAALKEARAQFAAGHLTQAQLTAVEDEQIKTLVDHELAAGLQAVTDGEFRRSYWHLDTFWGFAGIAHIKTKRGYLFHAEETRNDSAIVTGKIKFTGTHPDLAAFKFLNNLVKDKPNVHARQSIPAPAQLYSELVRTPKHIEALRQVYATDAELLHDIAQAYHDLILALYDAGCRDLKFDDCTWGMVVDQKFFATINGSKDQQEQTITNYLTVNNLALANLPEDLRVSTHVCRGNYHSTWAAAGGYGPVSDYLFAKENVSAFYLEFDDDRSGDFAPLAKVPAGKDVVLGLVTSKHPELESPATLKRRIKEASKYVPLDHLALSTQCGFASTEEGNQLTEEQQWAKIKLVIEVANEVWPN